MPTLAHLDVIMGADVTQFEKKMGGAGKTVINLKQTIQSEGKSAESSLTSMFGGIGSLAARYLGPLAAGAFVGWGVKLAADAEKAQTAFSTMLGSADKAQVLLKQISEFAASTPFESPELRTAAQSLLSFGVSAGNVMNRLKTLGDVAAGSNSEISDLALIYGKTLAKGKFELEQGNQLAERGIPIYATLAKNMGKSQQEIMAMITAGQVTSDDVLRSFETMAGAGGIFADAMGKQSKTIWGLWSSLTDNIGLIATDIGQMVVDAFGFKGGLTSLVDATGTIREVIGEWEPVFNAAVDVVATGFDVMTGLVSEFAAFVQPTIQPVLDFFTGTFGATFTEVRDNFLAMFFGMQWAIQNWQAFVALGATEAALAFETFSADVTNIFTNVIPTIFNNFGTAAMQFFTNLGTNISTVFKEVFDYIQSGGTDAIQLDFKPLILEEITKAFDRELTASERALMTAIDIQRGVITNEMGNFVNEKMIAAGEKAAEISKDILGKETKGDQTGDTKKKTTGKESKTTALEKGSTAAFEASQAARKDNPMLNAIDKQTQVAEKQTDLLTEIAKNTSGGATLAPI